MTFRVGQKVTMKASRPFLGMKPGEVPPEFGKVYTVRDLVTFGDTLIGLQFAEIANPKTRSQVFCMECHFAANAFRPVVTRKTDISIFTRMLDQTKVHAQ